MPGFNLSDDLLYQITVPISTGKEPIFDDAYTWSDELSNKCSYKVTA